MTLQIAQSELLRRLVVGRSEASRRRLGFNGVTVFILRSIIEKQGVDETDSGWNS